MDLISTTTFRIVSILAPVVIDHCRKASPLGISEILRNNLLRFHTSEKTFTPVETLLVCHLQFILYSPTLTMLKQCTVLWQQHFYYFSQLITCFTFKSSAISSGENSFESTKLALTGDHAQTVKHLIATHVIQRTALSVFYCEEMKHQLLAVAYDKCKVYRIRIDTVS